MPTYRQRDTQLATHTMKNLCITGSVQTSLDSFANVLRQAGATPALPASRNADMSMATWHRKVLATHSVHAEDPDTSPTLGRAWEQMAGDIFLANHEQPLWFWAESGSVPLLDFWREFDPSTCFVLLHTSPKQALFEAINRGANSPEELENVLDSWYQRTQQVLRFHLRHPARSILLDGDDALSKTSAYIEALASRWQLPLTPMDIEPPVQASDSLLVYLVDRLLQNRPEVLALDGEVQASLFQPSEVSPLTPAPGLDDALLGYLKTRRQHVSEQTEHAVLLEKLKTTKTQLERTRSDLSETRASLTSAEEENRLLLEQLHQTQEDYEKLVLDNQRSAREQESQNQKVAQQLAASTATKEQLAQENAALQTRLVAITQAQQQQLNQIEETKRENKQLLLQLHQAKEQREQLILDIRRSTVELESQNQKASERLAAVTTAKEQLTQENAALQTRLVAITQAQQQQLTQIEETESENELLLLNLHQTQEELEQYFLRTQATEAQCEKLRSCLQRALNNHPDYWAFDTLEASLLESTDTQQTVQWHLTDVYLGERLISELRFKTVLINGLAGIVIQRSAGIDSPEPLLRWPGACAAAEELPCIPVQGSAAQGNNALLSALGPTDWRALQALAKNLAALLDKPDAEQLPTALDAAGLRNGLNALEATLVAWPNLLRYDAIQLHETPQGDGYQSLAISLTNLQLGERHWSALDYRLATVDEPGQSFGQNPRLEFPESTRNALQSWFAESDDERGARLELRFARPEAMDTRVWNRLDGDDRLLIAALIVNFGTQLEELRQASVASQPGQDWQSVVELMKSILARNTVAPRQTQGA